MFWYWLQDVETISVWIVVGSCNRKETESGSSVLIPLIPLGEQVSCLFPFLRFQKDCDLGLRVYETPIAQISTPFSQIFLWLCISVCVCECAALGPALRQLHFLFCCPQKAKATIFLQRACLQLSTPCRTRDCYSGDTVACLLLPSATGLRGFLFFFFFILKQLFCFLSSLRGVRGFQARRTWQRGAVESWNLTHEEWPSVSLTHVIHSVFDVGCHSEALWVSATLLCGVQMLAWRKTQWKSNGRQSSVIKWIIIDLCVYTMMWLWHVGQPHRCKQQWLAFKKLCSRSPRYNYYNVLIYAAVKVLTNKTLIAFSFNKLGGVGKLRKRAVFWLLSRGWLSRLQLCNK